MRQNQISPKHSDEKLARAVPVNDNQGHPEQTQTTFSPTSPAPVGKPFIRRILVPTMIAIALALTAGWVIVLGYEIVVIIERAL